MPSLLYLLIIRTTPYPFVYIRTFFPPGVPGPPGVIRVEEIGDTWVKLLWTKGADHNSPILSYTIQTRHYWSLNEDDWRNASTCEYCSLPVGGPRLPAVWMNWSIVTLCDLIASTCKETHSTLSIGWSNYTAETASVTHFFSSTKQFDIRVSFRSSLS